MSTIDSARRMSEVNPILGYDLERTAVAMTPKIKEAPKLDPISPDKVIKCAGVLKDSNDADLVVRCVKVLPNLVKPLLENRADIASVRIQAASALIRAAHSRPSLRPHVLPIIYKLTGR